MTEARARTKDVGASPKRLKPILDLIRGATVRETLDTLSLLDSPWSRVVSKVVKSAASNAENNLLMDPDSLVVSRITADGARSLKRFRPSASGRIGRINKRSSHITVVVSDTREVT